jgi:virulence factor
MQIALLGLGEIARKAYLPLLSNRSDINLLINSRSTTTMNLIQQQYRDSKIAHNLDELIQLHPQAAFVLTPKETHFKIVSRLLESGIDVFVEKPATLTSSETQKLAQLAEKQGCILMVGFNRRYAPIHIQAKNLLNDNDVSIALFQKYRSSPPIASLFEQFIEDTIHQIDLMRYYCGEGEVVSTVYHIQDDKMINAVSTVTLSKGGTAILATDLQAGSWIETYTIHSLKKSLYIEAFSSLHMKVPKEETVWEETYASSWKTNLDGRGFTNEVKHFFECIKNRQQPQTSAWDSVKTQLLLEQMVAKAKMNY